MKTAWQNVAFGVCAFVVVFAATRVWQGRAREEISTPTRPTGAVPVATLPGMV